MPIALGVDTPIYLSLYGTGIRNHSALANVTCTIGGISVPVQYAGPQLQYAGVDQVNVALTLNLRNIGEADVIVTRQAHGTRLVHDCALDALADPPSRVGRKAESAFRLEFIDRTHQAEVAFLDQIQQHDPTVDVMLGDR